MANQRMSRVNGEVQKALASIISKFDDSELSNALISIMKVDTYSDFSYAKVYVSVFGDQSKKQMIVKKLNDNQRAIRYELAHKVKMRVVPELHFIVDDVEEKAERMMKLFEQIEGDGSDAK